MFLDMLLHVSFLSWRAKNWTQDLRCSPTSVEYRGKTTSSLWRWLWQGVEWLKTSTEDQRKKGSTLMGYTILFPIENSTPQRGLHLIGNGARDIPSMTPSRCLPQWWCHAQAICLGWDERHCTLPLTLLFIDFPKSVQLSCMLFLLPKNWFFLKQSLHIVQISAKSFLKIEVAIYSDVQISQQRLFEYRNQRHEVIEGSSTLSQCLVSILKHKVEQGLTIQWALRTMLPKSLLTILQSGGWMYTSPRPIRTEVSRVCDCPEVISELTTVMSR